MPVATFIDICQAAALIENTPSATFEESGPLRVTKVQTLEGVKLLISAGGENFLLVS